MPLQLTPRHFPVDANHSLEKNLSRTGVSYTKRTATNDWRSIIEHPFVLQWRDYRYVVTRLTRSFVGTSPQAMKPYKSVNRLWERERRTDDEVSGFITCKPIQLY